MAIIIPAQIKDEATSGEKKIFNLLRETLDDKYIVYYNPVLSTSIPTNPDFVILGDDFGIVVLEVKDFRRDTIREVNPNNFLIRTTESVKSVSNPFLQVKGYAETIKDVLEDNYQLVNHEGVYRGQLKFPYGYAVIFPYLSRRDSTYLQLSRVIPSNCLFLKPIFRTLLIFIC